MASLKLNFSHQNTDIQLSPLNNAFDNLESLQNLTLNFGSNKIEEISFLNSSLHSIRKLDQLTLDFSNNHIRDIKPLNNIFPSGE